MQLPQEFIDKAEVERELLESASNLDTVDIVDPEQEMANLQEKMLTKAKADALFKAQKIVKKNRREIARLKKHAEKCVLTDNYFGYQYAIKKLRAIYQIKSDNLDIPTLWATTQKELHNIIHGKSKGS